jgi:hypothetical protein
LVAQLGGVVARRVAATVVAATRHQPHLPRDGEEVVAAVHLVGEEVRRRGGRGRQGRGRGHHASAHLAVPVHSEGRRSVVAGAVVVADADDAGVRELLGGGAAGLLELAGAAAGAGAAVLEPVEDVGVADGAEALEEAADARRLILGRVHHAAVEDGLEDQDLLRLRRPPRPRRRRLAALAAAVSLAVVRVHGGGEEERGARKWSKLAS